MNGNAVVTGAGSGVGRQVALELIRREWRVALVGRRANALKDTVQQAHPAGTKPLVCPCDIGDPIAVAGMSQHVLEQFADVDVLVNAAGINVPRRSLESLAPEDYRRVLDANLDGAYFCVQAFLPGMRKQGTGTIVNIVSDAGKWANAKAGPAYVMSKFGLAGLTQSVNAEERTHGIRACAVFPGDINTPLLDQRPQPPAAEQRAHMLQPEDVAACVLLCITLPQHALVEEILVRPTGA